MFSAYKVSTLAEKVLKYKNIPSKITISDVITIIDGETISFSDFPSNRNITCFYKIEPDTLWIKGKPKKNPKEGKDFVLRKLYQSEFEVNNNKTNYSNEFTPAIEFAGAQFVVEKIETCKNIYAYSTGYKAFLKNIASGEKLIWDITKSQFGDMYFKIHLCDLINSVGLIGKNVYSAEKKLTINEEYTNFKEYKCLNFDAFIVNKRYVSDFNFKITVKDENNVETTVSLSNDQTNSYITGKVWFDEVQVNDAKGASMTYEINHKVDLMAEEIDSIFDFKFIMVSVNKMAKVYQSLAPSYSYDNNYSDYLSLHDIIVIGDKVTIRGYDYYKAVYDGKAFFISTSDVTLTEEDKLQLDTLISCSQKVRDDFFEYSKKLSYLANLDKEITALKEIESHKTKGISIPTWKVYDMSEYTDGTGISFTFVNPTNKIIKYVNVSFVGFNAVDDRVGKLISKRCIGPIEPNEEATYSFDYTWFTDIVEYAKITSISVQYKDGTTKTITKPSSVFWSDSTKKVFYEKKLDKFKIEIINESTRK